MAECLASSLYLCRVRHRRLRPFVRSFRHRFFAALVDLDELPRLGRSTGLLRHNRPGLLSIHDRDHGPRDGRPLKPWIEGELARAGVTLDGGRVFLLAMPRVLGFSFNPLSLWLCYGPRGDLRAVLYDVSNTFGEAHGYLLPLERPAEPGKVIVQSSAKDFYVSPFIGLDAHYRFRLRLPGRQVALAIALEESERPLLLASLAGNRRPLDGRNLLAQFLRRPLQALGVLLAIHWQAWKLWRRGAAFHRRPAPPRQALTVIGGRDTTSEMPS